MKEEGFQDFQGETRDEVSSIRKLAVPISDLIKKLLNDFGQRAEGIG